MCTIPLNRYNDLIWALASKSEDFAAFYAGNEGFESLGKRIPDELAQRVIELLRKEPGINQEIEELLPTLEQPERLGSIRYIGSVILASFFLFQSHLKVELTPNSWALTYEFKPVDGEQLQILLDTFKEYLDKKSASDGQE